MSSVSIKSNLPEGWVPDGAAVLVIAKVDNEDDQLWESVVPEFSIVGRGSSAEDALINALELLDDYLLVSAREGRSFDDVRRPLSRRTGLPILAELLHLDVRSKVRRKPGPPREQRYRVPLRLSGVH